MPETVLPQSMPTTGTIKIINTRDCFVGCIDGDLLYCSGFQKGSTAIAKRIPMIETGIVEPSIPASTDRNWAQYCQSSIRYEKLPLADHVIVSSFRFVND